jgi:ribonuclease HI
MSKHIVIYTDGSCESPRGAGGWCGHIEKEDGTVSILSGNATDTTNNRMELTAIIETLKSLEEPSVVLLYSDSRYIIDAINKRWIDKWIANNWMTSGLKERNILPSPVKNRDLFEQLISMMHKHKIQFVWVKAHADSETNNKVDQIARDEMRKLAPLDNTKKKPFTPYNSKWKKYKPKHAA